MKDKELYWSYREFGGNLFVNPKSTIEDQIFELINKTFKQLHAERAARRVRYTPTGIAMVSCKDKSYKPQAASAMKQTQKKDKIKT